MAATRKMFNTTTSPIEFEIQKSKQRNIDIDLDYDEDIVIGEREEMPILNRFNDLNQLIENHFEEEIKDEPTYDFYFDCLGFFRGSRESRANCFMNFILELDRLSWSLFESNKNYGANSIDIFSPQIARLFDLTNLITDNIKFETKQNYCDKNSFLIGKLNNRYDVFMPKKIRRLVLSEKYVPTKSDKKFSDRFIEGKLNKIELYNSEMLHRRFKIVLENIEF